MTKPRLWHILTDFLISIFGECESRSVQYIVSLDRVNYFAAIDISFVTGFELKKKFTTIIFILRFDQYMWYIGRAANWYRCYDYNTEYTTKHSTMCHELDINSTGKTWSIFNLSILQLEEPHANENKHDIHLASTLGR